MFRAGSGGCAVVHTCSCVLAHTFLHMQSPLVQFSSICVYGHLFLCICRTKAYTVTSALARVCPQLH